MTLIEWIKNMWITIKEKIDIFIYWDSLYSYIYNRLFTSLTVIFILFPLFVKSALFVEDSFILITDFFGYHIDINIPLPFSIYVLYIGSIGVFFGTLLFNLFCPKQIVDENVFSIVKGTSISKQSLIQLFTVHSSKPINDLLNKLKNEIYLDENNLYKYFHELNSHSIKLYFYQRLLVAILLSGGYSSLFYVTIQNILSSLEYIQGV